MKTRINLIGQRCIQEKGESIYFPANWAHTVLTTSTTTEWSALLGHCLWLPQNEHEKNQNYIDMRYVTGHDRVGTGKEMKKRKRRYSQLNTRHSRQRRKKRSR